MVVAVHNGEVVLLVVPFYSIQLHFLIKDGINIGAGSYGWYCDNHLKQNHSNKDGSLI